MTVKPTNHGQRPHVAATGFLAPAKPFLMAAKRSFMMGSPLALLLGAVVALAVLVSPVMPAGSQALAQGTKKAAPKGGAVQENAALRKRVRQLEEQLLDMQVMIGTLQSMTSSGGGGGKSSAGLRPSAAGGNAAGTVRMQQLETQIQALTAQVQNLSEKVSGNSQRRSDAGGADAFVPSRRYADAPMAPVDGLRPSSSLFAGPSSPGGGALAGFGSTTVTPSGAARSDSANKSDGIGNYLSRGDAVAPSRKTRQIASSGVDPKQLYETAYGYLLQQNFGRAQAAFTDFLEQYPSDPLAGNAQYWLGETFYVRSKYRSAAKAFLKGYQSYAKSNKAADSLLKLAMSFDRLGQKDAACSSYGELTAKFPAAPSHVRNRAQSETKRLGC